MGEGGFSLPLLGGGEGRFLEVEARRLAFIRLHHANS